MFLRFTFLTAVILASLSCVEAADIATPPPTHADAKYGPHARNVLDFWKAPSDKPTPVIVYIHGGGFLNGDKSGVRKDTIIAESLARGISFAAINYRYRTTAPIQDILRDCARAVQFLRTKSDDWNIDKTRFAAYGGSAGAGTSLWLAFHDDLADSKSEDPILRESSRLICAGAISTQFSYDLPKWKELFGEQAKSPAEELLMPFFYGFTKKEDLDTERGKAIRADCDMCGLIDRSDPPVFLTSKQPGGNVTNHNHLLHHPLHAKTIYDTCRAAGIPAVADLPGLKIKPAASDPADLRKFLYHHLQAAKPN